MDAVRYVLVEPQSGGNVGAAARAIKNLGFHRLVLVAPRCDPAGLEARSLAVDATDVLAAAVIAADLDRALDGAGVVIGTSRRRGRQRRPHWRFDALTGEIARLAQQGDVAIVFGREDQGLSDAELDRCTHLAHFLAAEAYPSFNLAQAVLLAAYEVRRALSGPPAPAADDRLAGHAEREAMYVHLREALLAVGFLHDETAEGMMRRLRRMLGRAALTPGDVQVVRGIARQVMWVAGRAPNSR